MTWQPHSEDCTTCQQTKCIRGGGRPAKDTGRPAASSRKSLISLHPHTSTHAPQSINTPQQYGVSLNDLTCNICLHVVDQPVELVNCATLVCTTCLTSWLYECADSLPCPCCHRNLSDPDNDIRRVNSVVQWLMEGLLVSCTCGETVTNNMYAMHTTGGSIQDNGVSQERVITISDVLSQPVNSPLTPVERQLQTTLAKRSTMVEKMGGWFGPNGGARGREHSCLFYPSRTYHSIPDWVERLKVMMREHYLHSTPSLVAERPPVKRRKKGDK